MTATQTAKEELDAHIRTATDAQLSYSINTLSKNLEGKGPKDAEFIAYFGASREFRNRRRTEHEQLADAELASIMTDGMATAWGEQERTAQMTQNVVEDLLFKRHPDAEQAMDAFIDEMARTSTDDYEHLRVFLEKAGL